MSFALPDNFHPGGTLTTVVSARARFRLKGNLDLQVTARCCGSNGDGDPVGMFANAGPLGAARQNDKGDATRLNFLLISDAPVGR